METGRACVWCGFSVWPWRFSVLLSSLAIWMKTKHCGAHFESIKRSLGFLNACTFFDCLLHATYKNVTVAKKKASENRGSFSLHRGRLKVRDNDVHVLFTVWWKKHRLRLLHLHGNRDEHRSRQQECQSDRTYRQLAVILGRPRTCLIIQQREEVVQGREREKKNRT